MRTRMARTICWWVAALVVSVAGPGCGSEPPWVSGELVIPEEEDAEALLRLLEADRKVLDELAERIRRTPDDYPITGEEREAMLRLWAEHVDYAVALDATKLRFWPCVRRAETEEARDRCFVLGFAAFAGQLRASLLLTLRADDKEGVQALLASPPPELGVDGVAWERNRQVGLNDDLFDRFEEGLEHLLRTHPEVADWRVLIGGGDPDDDFGRLAREGLLVAAEAAQLERRVGLGLRIAQFFDDLTDAIFDALYPVQAGLVAAIGKVRVNPDGRSLISPEQVESLILRMQPGDIVVQRRNWYLSNVGLPGFWPHSAYYLGSAEELAQFLDDDPEVRQHWPRGFTRHLAERYPFAWKVYSFYAVDGHPYRFIEALAEGVVFTSAQSSLRADYVGVMRPRRTRLETARAIEYAFGQANKPYDFDFDFLTDDKLVCTELIYKSHQLPASVGRSLRIGLVRVAGRTTLPANELVRAFAEQADRDDRDLDFVAFLDGVRREGRAVDAGADAFRRSYRRSKWDFNQR